MLDTAIIHLGLKPDEFWNMTMCDFVRYGLHISIKEAKEWDKFRTLYSYILNTSVSKKSDQKKPKEILPLPILDRYKLYKEKINVPTKEEKAEMLKNASK